MESPTFLICLMENKNSSLLLSDHETKLLLLYNSAPCFVLQDFSYLKSLTILTIPFSWMVLLRWKKCANYILKRYGCLHLTCIFENNNNPDAVDCTASLSVNITVIPMTETIEQLPAELCRPRFLLLVKSRCSTYSP